MISFDKYQELKKKAELLKTQADKAQGALEQRMTELKKEFECDSIEEAETFLEKLTKEQQEKESEFDKEFEKFEKEWGEKLAEVK